MQHIFKSRLRGKGEPSSTSTITTIDPNQIPASIHTEFDFHESFHQKPAHIMSRAIAPRMLAPCYVTRRLYEVCGCTEVGLENHENNCVRDLEMHIASDPNMREKDLQELTDMRNTANPCKGLVIFWQVDETICPICESDEQEKFRQEFLRESFPPKKKPRWFNWFKKPSSLALEPFLEYDLDKTPQEEIDHRVAFWDEMIASQRARRAEEEEKEKTLRGQAWEKVREREERDVENGIPIEDRLVLVRPATPSPVPQLSLRGIRSRW